MFTGVAEDEIAMYYLYGDTHDDDEKVGTGEAKKQTRERVREGGWGGGFVLWCCGWLGWLGPTRQGSLRLLLSAFSCTVHITYYILHIVRVVWRKRGGGGRGVVVVVVVYISSIQ